MKHSNFVHLHLHTQYSLLDGAIRLDDLFARANEFSMPAVAITDHGNLFGAIDFYTKASSAGLKPIIGCEIYLAPNSRFEKKATSTGETAYHLILLVKNTKGYKNLCRLVTSGYLEGFYYKPRIDKELLRAHSEGLIALSACLHGEIPHLIQMGNIEKAYEVAKEFKEIFPDRRFFLEVMDNKLPEQREVNRVLFDMGRELDIPLVATNDCHYLNRDDARAHDVLLCIQTGKHVSSQDRLSFRGSEFYFKSPQEMATAFHGHPELLQNTIEIAERCNLELKLNEHHFPIFPVPQGETLDSYLERLARDGLEDRLDSLKKKAEVTEEFRRMYYARLEKELDIIKKMGYSGYFLIVSDFINFARSRDIPVGPGRGSAAGSLVAYALKITNLDPIEHGLIFERFLNPGRVSLPDIDIDFCIDGRDEVISYVAERYGKENVAQIITFGKMQAKAVIRDVGRALNIPYAEVDKIAKLIPDTPNITIDQSLKEEPRLTSACEENPKIKELIDIARSLEGLTRHASTHAAGVVIANRPLVDYMPLYKGQKDEVITTQYAMKEVEQLGLLKFDFLGLKTLTLIDKTIRLVKTNRGEEIKIDEIPMDDEETFNLFSRGATNGIFQLEGSGVKDILIRIKPEKFEDIIAVVALYRPGPLGSGMVDDFIDRKHGRKKVRYELPQLKEILENTYGVILYQEQVMQIATLLADFSLADADILRRAMGKKKPKEMAEQKDKFLKGARKNRVPLKKAEKIFDLMAKFAGYGFNKSHSAAYALIAYQTAYLKCHYPTEFMTALLTLDITRADKVIKYIGECRDMGIEVLPPDVNESYRDFTISGEKIRFGLGAVKNVGDSAIEAIVEARDREGVFISLLDFCTKVDLKRVNRRVIESLIKAGAFDFTGFNRSQLIGIMDRCIETGIAEKKDRESGQMSIFGNVSYGSSDLDMEIPDMDEWDEQNFLTYEKEALGFYITKHPLEGYMDRIERIVDADSETIVSKEDGGQARVCGLVSAVKETLTRKKERMAFITIEDTKGYIEVIVFSELYRRSYEYIQSDMPIVIYGTVDKEAERVKLIAREIMPLSEAEKGAPSKVFLRIDVDRTSRGQLKAIKDLLSSHPGDHEVYLYLQFPHGKKTVVALPEYFRIEPDKELGNKAKEILGYDPMMR